MIVRRCFKRNKVVAGGATEIVVAGGATEMELSKRVKEHSVKISTCYEHVHKSFINYP
jgi:hypothetical protein